MVWSRLRKPALFLVTALALALLTAVGCGEAATTAPEAPATSAPAPAATEAPAPVTATNPQAPTPAAAPTSAPTPAQASVVASGQMSLAWHAGLSSSWLDPQDNPAMATPYNFAYALHDAVVKIMPQALNTPSLAESWEWAEDFSSITFQMRPGTSFHNGEPVTTEDVKFTFENYSGAQADVFQASTAGVDVIDPSTIRFNFNAPFLDFLLLYGTFSSGAGFVVPADYYQEVGNEGFIQAPVGAGPFKLLEELPGDSLRFEAFEDYHRPVHVKEFTMRSVQEPTTRLALIEAGDVDVMYNVAGELIERVVDNPDLLLVPTLTTAVFWLEFPHMHNPDNPFNDVRVREAVGLALDRQAISDAETGGHARPANYWIPPNILLAPPHEAPEEDLDRAKQLMAEAGYPDGFDVEWLSPIPNYFSLGERVISQIRRIGINAKLQTMERGTFFDRLAEGDTYQERNDAWGGETQILLIATGTAGAFVARFNAYVGCEAASSRMCDPEIDGVISQYEASVDPDERERLAADAQDKLSAGFYKIPIYWFSFINAIGPRIANRDQWGEGKEIFANPQMEFYGPPWENWKVVDN
jgi:peptide/nickel transport system substrate-binding protein